MSIGSTIDENIIEIQQLVIRMGQAVEDMVRDSCAAVCNNDVELARQMAERDNHVDALEQEVINKVILAMVRRAPVAHDLRWLTAIFGVVAEIEQAGDDTVKLSRGFVKLSGNFPAELKADFAELGEMARQFFARALKLTISYSEEEAVSVISADQVIDQKYKDSRLRVTDMVQAHPDRTREFIRVIASFHALEHIADHSVEIAKRLRTHLSKPA